MKILRPVLVAFGFLLIVSTVHAQDPMLKASIPFSFVVGNRALPAGDYLLSDLNPNSWIVAVRDETQPVTAVAGTQRCSLTEPSKTSKLVFHRMGNEYFLYQVWVEGKSTGREFPKSKWETQMAKNHTDADEVIVAAVITH